MYLRLTCSLVACLAAYPVVAQDRASAPEFEVASVKPTATNYLNSSWNYPGGRIEMRGYMLLYLVMQAYDVQAFQVSGGPPWLDQDRFDIDAKPPASSPASKLTPPNTRTALSSDQRQMLQTLLAQRFALRAHRETREGQVFLLTRGKKTLRLNPAKDPSQTIPWSGGLRGGMITGDGMAGISETMPDLAWRLSRYLLAPVIDQTGIEGAYDFAVPYSTGEARPDIPSLIFAVVDQLGLKLEKSRGPVETIVIEHAEKPSAN